MKNVISISLGASHQDFEFTAQFLGEPMTVRRLGTDGSVARAEKLLKQWDGQADAIGLAVVKDGNGGGWLRRDENKDLARLEAVVKHSPLLPSQSFRVLS